jgi:hypothetical protein
MAMLAYATYRKRRRRAPLQSSNFQPLEINFLPIQFYGNKLVLRLVFAELVCHGLHIYFVTHPATLIRPGRPSPELELPGRGGIW